jgi:hypothetical protein
MKNIAPESINRIRRIYDDTTILQAFHHRADQPWLRIVWMYANDHIWQENDEKVIPEMLNF